MLLPKSTWKAALAVLVIGAGSSYGFADTEESRPSGLSRSLFDHLMYELASEATGDSAFKIPFPFEKLVAAIESHTGQSATRILIPLGRSLQRLETSPQMPRVVIGFVDRPVKGHNPRLNLRDRLFIGYSEKADQLEVISYNDEGHRYEFQVVRNYSQGNKREVHYADRTLCLTCHQNGATIFSLQDWDETNSNAKMQEFITKSRGDSDYHGAKVVVGKEVPYFLDKSVDRASSFATLLVDRYWVEACGPDEKSADAAISGTECRAQLLMNGLAQAAPNALVATAARFRQRELEILPYADFVQFWKQQNAEKSFTVMLSDVANRFPERAKADTTGTRVNTGNLLEDILKNSNIPADVGVEPSIPRKGHQAYEEEVTLADKAHLDRAASLIAATFSEWEVREMKRTPQAFANVQRAIKRLVEKANQRDGEGKPVSTALMARSFNRAEIVAALFGELELDTRGGIKKDTTLYYPLKVEGEGGSVIDIADPGLDPDESQLKADFGVFAKYCTSCHFHQRPDSATYGFFYLEQNVSYRKVINRMMAKGEAICDRINYKASGKPMMPQAHVTPQPSPQERTAMLAILKRRAEEYRLASAQKREEWGYVQDLSQVQAMAQSQSTCAGPFEE